MEKATLFFLKEWNQAGSSYLGKEFENIAIVTHGGVIRELLVRYAPEEKLFWDWKIPHAGGYQLVWDNQDLWRRGERCTSLQVVPIMEKQNG